VNIENFIQSLQAAIAPCIFISGLGLLLLTMTNRLGRAIDRIRHFADEIKSASSGDIPALKKQVVILYRRAWCLQAAIGLISISLLCVALIMLMLFTTLAFNFQIVFSFKLLFVISLISFILSLLFFFVDVSLTLASVRIEIEKI
jgi:hypothetical protein